MSTRDIKKLASFSFTKGELDESKVEKIAKKLSKSDLREYIKALKLINDKNTVKVWSSTKLDRNAQESIKKMFKGKKIQLLEDKELIAGVRIEDYDNIYELNLKDSLNSMVDYVKEN